MKMNFIHFIDDHVEEICKNGHIGIEHIFKNRCLTLEIIRRNYKYLRGIVKAYYPCKATLCSCAKKNTDEQLSELISRNPNIRLKDILEKLRDTVVENSEEIFFTKDTIDYWDLASKINVDELKFCYENNIFTTKLNGENSELFNFEWRLLCRLSKKASLKELEENPFIYSGEKFKKISNEIKSCWRALSANPNITLEFIKKHPEIKWDERELCKNPGLTIKDLYQLKE